jgi:hypothetical protein
MAMDPKQERALSGEAPASPEPKEEDRPRDVSDEARERAGKEGGQDAGRTGHTGSAPDTPQPRRGMGEDHR